MKPLILLTSDQKVAEIKRLYYATTRLTIQQDLAKAIDLVKSMGGEAERERVAVYMDGLAQMRSDWAGQGGKWKGIKKSRKSKVKSRKSKVESDR